MQTKHNILTVVFITIFSFGFSYDLNAANLRKVITVNGGPSWENAGQTQTLNMQSDLPNTYVAQKNTHQLTNIGLFLGLQKTIYQHYQAQLGISGAIFSSANLSGQIWELADERFNNLTYKYRVDHSHLAIEGKVFANIIHPSLLPYFSLSLGVAQNKSFGFSSTPLIFEVLEQPPFSSHNQIAFTYTLGLGLVKLLGEHWQAGLGYSLTDEGKSSLGSSDGQTTSDRLTLNHLYVNTLQFSISYLS
ncbi:MAG: porin family protein [Legionellaceae bacterium]|nr:porin family protein [Legionellaceae bacterium]